MRRKIAAREEVIDGLEVALSNAQRQVADQTRKVNAEARRADVAERTQREDAESIRGLERRSTPPRSAPPRRSCSSPSSRPSSTC